MCYFWWVTGWYEIQPTRSCHYWTCWQAWFFHVLMLLWMSLPLINKALAFQNGSLLCLRNLLHWIVQALGICSFTVTCTELLYGKCISGPRTWHFVSLRSFNYQNKKNMCWNLAAHLKPGLLKSDTDVACHVRLTWVPELSLVCSNMARRVNIRFEQTRFWTVLHGPTKLHDSFS